MKLINKIPAIMLWAAWLLITAHSVIPHDHHSPELLVQNESSCPNSENTTSHHPFIPGHCHALNDLTCEKALVYSFNCNITCHDFLPAENVCQAFFDSYINSEGFFEITAHFQVSYLPDHSPLRAPPALS